MSEPESGYHTDLSAETSYANYLRLDLLLAAQQPRSTHHDEVLFITAHQVWPKSMEIQGAPGAVLSAFAVGGQAKVVDDADARRQFARHLLEHRRCALPPTDAQFAAARRAGLAADAGLQSGSDGG